MRDQGWRRGRGAGAGRALGRQPAVTAHSWSLVTFGFSLKGDVPSLIVWNRKFQYSSSISKDQFC